jgi:Fe-S cluster assembly iron-binding protein IscA
LVVCFGNVAQAYRVDVLAFPKEERVVQAFHDFRPQLSSSFLLLHNPAITNTTGCNRSLPRYLWTLES